MKRIPSEFIQKLLNHVDIISVVSKTVTLKKAGHEYHGLCPFHQEKTPSFTISPKKQFYHCFGCHAHGNAIDFAMQQQNLSFPEAVKQLSEACGLEMPELAQNDQPHFYQEGLDLLQSAAEYYQKHLARNPKAQDYLEQRGLSPKTIQHYQLGFAPAQQNALLQSKARKILDEVGLTGHGRPKFFNRITFPIHNKKGQTIAFGGRALQKEQQPKYLNSRETHWFHKNQTLYGLHQARLSPSLRSCVYVVEGYMDVCMLFEQGIENAVATLGTAISENQLRMLKQNSERILFCFDGDAAGKRAAKRSFERALPLIDDQTLWQFLFLPDGLDPDAYIRNHGKECWIQLSEQAMSFDAMLFELIDQPIRDMHDQASFAHQAMAYINPMPSSLYKEMILAKLSDKVGLDVERLSKKPPKPQPKKDKPKMTFSPLIKEALLLLIQNPSAAEPFSPFLKKYLPDEGQLLYEVNETSFNEKPSHTGALLALLEHHDAIVVLQDMASIATTHDDAKNAYQDVIRRIEEKITTQMIDQLLAQSNQTTLTDSQKKTLQKLLEYKSQLQSKAQSHP